MPSATSLSLWQRRIQRAHELASQYPSASEILAFYIHLAGFQEGLWRGLSEVLGTVPGSGIRELNDRELSELSSRFASFLSVAERYAPAPLAKLILQLRARGTTFWCELLRSTWSTSSPSDPEKLLAQI